MQKQCLLESKIAKLESDHKAYVEFGTMNLIGILATTMWIDQMHEYSLWIVVIALTVSLIATIAIAVKKDLEKDKYMHELEQFQAISLSSTE